jgi:hypothetical protein
MGKLLCFLGSHDYRLIERISAHCDHIGCPRCGREWGINYSARALVPWADVRGAHEEIRGRVWPGG